MTVQHESPTVTIPAQAGPADPPLATQPGAGATAGVPGRDRRLTKDEREFVLSMAVVFGSLSVIIVTFLLLAVKPWS